MGEGIPPWIVRGHLPIGYFVALSRLGGGDRSGPVDITVALEEGMSFGGHGDDEFRFTED